jgi:protein-S-isoprenylcysteine O-methyltransferase Ste14
MPMNDDAMPPAALGALLVGLQFALLAGLAATAATAFDAARLPLDAVVVAAAAVALGGWALSANRPGNFNIRPVPREGGHLVQCGPYRWIRHPMYSALLLAGVAAARLSDGGAAWLMLAALAVVLRLKAGVEERAMAARYPAYADYRRRTRRFVPGLY